MNDRPKTRRIMPQENKKVFIVMKNADVNEGRGPMVVDSAFSKRELAAKYIDDRPGEQGRAAKWSEVHYGDWQIVDLDLDPEEEQFSIENVRQRIAKINEINRYDQERAESEANELLFNVLDRVNDGGSELLDEIKKLRKVLVG